MICPIMSRAAECPPIKIECSENCAWYIDPQSQQFQRPCGSCAMVELVNRTDMFEVSAAIEEVSEQVDELKNGFSGIIQTLYDR